MPDPYTRELTKRLKNRALFVDDSGRITSDGADERHGGKMGPQVAIGTTFPMQERVMVVECRVGM